MNAALLAQAPDLFARHLDLEPLRGRRRGSVRCIFHEERTPSLSVDLDRGVFYCFGCGEQGGIRRFAELVGESAPRPLRLVRRATEAERGRREVVEDADRARARLAGWSDVLAIVGWAWTTRETIRRVRAYPGERRGMTAVELQEWSRAMVAAYQRAASAELRGLGTFLASRLRPAAVSRERLRAAVASLDSYRPRMAARVEPVLRMHAALAGEPDPAAAAVTVAEQIVADYIEESRRQLRPLLDGAWPGHPAGTAALDRILEKWPARGERIAERLTRALEQED